MTYIKFHKPNHKKYSNYAKYADAFHKHVWNHTKPPVNISEDANNYYIEIAAPGLKKEDFSIKVEKNTLEVSSDVTQEKKYKKQEFDYGKFVRKFELPHSANKDSITAKYENGILYITIEKNVEAKPKTVNVS